MRDAEAASGGAEVVEVAGIAEAGSGVNVCVSVGGTCVNEGSSATINSAG